MIKLRNNIHAFFCLIMAALLFVSCDIGDNDVVPESSFSKIYNDESFTFIYDPLDIIQTPDSGFLILSSTEKWSTYLLKVDALGNVSYEIKVPAPFVNPLPGLYLINGSIHLFCMDEISLQTYLMRLNEETQALEVAQTFGDILYPLAASLTPDGGFLIQSYDRILRNTNLYKIQPNLNILWKNEYPIYEDVEEPLIAHLTRIGKRLPFLTGYLGDNNRATHFFFNGYNNYLFSMTFVNINNGEQTGVINGYQDKGAISGASTISDNKMALSRYSFNDNFLLPLVDVNPTAVEFSGNIVGVQFPELLTNAKVIIKQNLKAGKSLMLYATSTKSNQVVLYVYEAITGKMVGNRYWGDKNPYEIASLTETSDGGLAILCKTYVAGKFPRICLIKLSAEELDGLSGM